MKKLALIVAASCLAACQAETPPAKVVPDSAAEAPTPADAMNDIADRYYAWTLERFPEQAYFAAVELDRHDGLLDNSPAALAAALSRAWPGAPPARLRVRQLIDRARSIVLSNVELRYAGGTRIRARRASVPKGGGPVSLEAVVVEQRGERRTFEVLHDDVGVVVVIAEVVDLDDTRVPAARRLGNRRLVGALVDQAAHRFIHHNLLSKIRQPKPFTPPNSFI